MLSIQDMQAPEVLETQVSDLQGACVFQRFTSLVGRQGGWFAIHALQRPLRGPVDGWAFFCAQGAPYRRSRCRR